MNDDCSDDFDYQSDFTQFLKEARSTAFQLNQNAVTNEKKQLDWEEKTQRKSWKKFLFSWLKWDSKNNSIKQPPQTTGPALKARIKRPVTSGPLIGLFGSGGSPEEKCEVPYMCLGELNKHKIQAYGPIYLVT
ncbi:uncharacterized protein LOC130990267 [Salvia miltiorrhiza]|uniref:uncharacterized protein LOC130990267 n=1 Tax=Salvia miltiorrhiza TaxID=226208 RepID=UPI0025ABC091|nr:uncharacterized protein LOC130990267 [Salvia miltiorrhiza]XP_057770486.1 uncharacterized protein LOC130990267 [Salvia miltiorrhiza]